MAKDCLCYIDYGKFDVYGFDNSGLHKETGTKYNPNGFGRDFKHKDTGTKFGVDGFDMYGYDAEGYNREGYNAKHFNRNGLHKRTNLPVNLFGDCQGGGKIHGKIPPSQKRKLTIFWDKFSKENANVDIDINQFALKLKLCQEAIIFLKLLFLRKQEGYNDVLGRKK